MKRRISLLLFLLVSLTTAIAGRAMDRKPADPFRTLWFYAADTTTRFPVAVDGDRVFLPLGQGVVRALRAGTGDLLWTAEVGGEISTPILPVADGILISLQQEGSGTLKKIDKTTGLTVWSHPLTRPFTSPLLAEGTFLYGGTQDGRVIAMEIETGRILWSVATGDVVRGTPTLGPKLMYIGSDDGSMYAIEKTPGNVLWKFKTQAAVRGRVTESDDRLMFGSRDGWFYALEKKTGRLKWKRRAGAAIEDANLVAGKIVVVGSYDNYLYGLSMGSGNSAWKVRLTERLAFELLPQDGAVLVAPLRGQKVSILSLENGEKLSEVKLEPTDGEIVARPVLQYGLLFLTTDKGLLASRQGP